MSKEQLKAFLEKVQGDTSLQEKLKAAADVDAVVTIAKAAGFVISADPVEAQAAEVLLSDEKLVLLSDEELKGVAGGMMAGMTEEAWDWTNYDTMKKPYLDEYDKMKNLL